MLAAWHAKSIPCRKLPGSILNAWIHFTALDEATATGRSLRCSPPDLAGGMSKYNRRCPTSFSHRRPCKTMDRMVTWAMASSKSDEDGGGKKNVDVNHVESSSDKVLTYTNAAVSAG